jgi:glycosyltransferase involved in cell wall biosynthesis
MAGYARRAASLFERLVVTRADAILFATHANRSEYAAHYGNRLADKFHVVTNGCDVDEVQALGSIRGSTEEFVLLHAGSLYGARTPLPLLRAIASGVRRGSIDPRKFRLRFVGSTGTLGVGIDLRAAVSQLNLDCIVEFVPRMARRDALEAMARASSLLVLQPGTTVSVPGKVYEYLAIGRPILAVAEEGETATLVRDSGIGISVRPDDERAIEAAVVQLVADAPRLSLTKPPAYLYDGNVAAGEAIAVIENVLSRHPRAGGQKTLAGEGAA